MRVAIIDNGTDCLENLRDLCNSSGFSYDIFPAESLSDLTLDEFELLILSGGVWYEDKTKQSFHYRQELKLIAESGTPILGICLGMLLVVAAFGGNIEDLEHRSQGEKSIRLTDTGVRILNTAPQIQVQENHTKSIKHLPDSLLSLGESDDGIEIVRHKQLPIAGVQFHPEMTHLDSTVRLWRSLIHDLVDVE